MRQGLLCMIASPAAGNRVEPGIEWCADNGCYSGTYPGDSRFLAWLGRRRAYACACRFVVAPDVPFDAAATLARSRPMFAAIREAGFRVALAAQNGQERLPVPWADIDCLFLAGDDRWKLGPHARRLALEARARGKWVHMGRANSLKRLRQAQQIGCHSADGTYLAYGPDRNLPTLLRWLATLNADQSTPAGVA